MSVITDKIKAYSIDLDKALDKTDKKTKAALEDVIQSIEKEIAARIYKEEVVLDSKKSTMSSALKMLIALKVEIAGIFKGYYDVAAEVTKEYEKLVPEIVKTFEVTGVEAEFSKRDKEVVKYLQQVSYDEFKDLGDTFQQELSKSIFHAIIGNKTAKEIVGGVSNQLIGHKDKAGRSMTSHAKTIVNDSILNFTRAIQYEKAMELDISYFQYVGTIIKTTRPFCAQRAGKIITSEQVQGWDNMTWAGKNPNLPASVACGGYNCRHHLQPLPNTVAKFIAEELGQKLPTRPTKKPR